MEEKSVRIYNTNTTFFRKITNTLSKLFVPTKVGINSFLISLKRNNLLKAYNMYVSDNIPKDKKESYLKKCEDYYAIYLEAIDKYIMESVYSNVKNGTATEFEKLALTNYYEITHLKDNEYLEYKYRKQKYLLELDYETINSCGKIKLRNKYLEFYINKVDSLYKSILKNYSVQLSDNIHTNKQYRNKIYLNIFDTLDEYVQKILPIKLEIAKENDATLLNKEYSKYERFTVGKLDEKDRLEKNVVLLGISRELFTHSLPLVVAEQCYIFLIENVRQLIINTTNKEKIEEVYNMLLGILKEFNSKLLSTKIYWQDPKDREEYKAFWDKYNNEENDVKKEILLLRRELKDVNKSTNDYKKLIKYYKEKLVKFGVMRNLKNKIKCINGRYICNDRLSRNRVCTNK